MINSRAVSTVLVCVCCFLQVDCILIFVCLYCVNVSSITTLCKRQDVVYGKSSLHPHWAIIHYHFHTDHTFASVTYSFCFLFVFRHLWWHVSPSGPKVLFLVIVVLASQNNNSRPQMSVRSSRYWVYTSGQMAGSCAVGAWLEWNIWTLLSHN